eukprot:1417834-Pyramimonas_sp.AAC.1
MSRPRCWSACERQQTHVSAACAKMPWLALAPAVPLSLRAKDFFVFACGACAARQSRDCICSGIACRR